MRLPCGCCRGVEELTPAEIFNRPGLPALAYRVGTHSTFFETMQASLAGWPLALPGPDASAPPTTIYPLRDLTTRDTSDPSIALLDAWATVGDVLTFYQERIANEGFLRTAVHRCSLLELARLVGYRLRPGVAASVFLAFTLEQGQDKTKDKNADIEIPKGTRAQSLPGPGELPQPFETGAKLIARAAWNNLQPRLTRPQKITCDNDPSFGAPNIETLYFQGTSTNLKTGDALLIVCSDAEGKQFLRFVQSVAADSKNERTEVVLQPAQQTPGEDLKSVVDRYVKEADDLFPGSKIAGAVKKALGTLSDFLGQQNLTRAQILEQVRLTLPQLEEQHTIAVRRNFTRMEPWIAELIRELTAAMGRPTGVEGSTVPVGARIQFAEGARIRFAGFQALGAIVDKLSLPPSVPPRSPALLSRSLKATFDPLADALPQLLATVRPELSDSLYQAWKNVQLPPSPVKVLALRTRARLFGHNAPPRIVKASDGVVTKWGDWKLFESEKDPDGTTTAISSAPASPSKPDGPHEQPNSIDLDASYNQILPDSWLVMETSTAGILEDQAKFITHPDKPLYAKAGNPSADLSRADYGMSGKTTRIQLADPKGSTKEIDWFTPNNYSPTGGQNFWAIRNTVVYAQPEEIALAEEPIDDDVHGNTIELDDLYDGLQAGRWLIVSGERTDVPGATGVKASELVMLAGVTQGGQAEECAKFPSGSIPFASVYYVTDPNDAGDRLLVGKPSPDLKALLGKLPQLPQPPPVNQVFCAPVELAPGVFAEAYVPTPEERGGNFSAFSGLLVDPDSGVPFGNPPNGQIPPGTLSSVFAWRIVAARDTVHTKLQLAQALSYSYDPTAVKIYGNVAKATHGETRTEILGSGDGSKALQAFTLSKPPLTYLAAATPSGAQSTLEVRVNGILWHEAESLADMQPGSRGYFTMADHEEKTSVIFGNGTHGARVPTGAANVKAVYRSGIGAPGNVAAEKISQLVTRPLSVKGVINPLPATGGADRDTVEQARRNTPVAVMALDRLVSIEDYADFTRAFAGVKKASATRLAVGNTALVHVTLAGVGDIPVDKGSDLFTSLAAALQRFGDPAEPVQLDRRAALLLVIKAVVRVLPDYLWENTQPKARAAMLDAFGFDNRELGQDAVLSEVFATLQAVEGVDYVKVEAFGAVSDMDDSGNAVTPEALTKQLRDLVEQAKLPPRVVANLARTVGNKILPAQIAYLSARVPDCLLLTELTG